jgi:hypothetical protein
MIRYGEVGAVLKGGHRRAGFRPAAGMSLVARGEADMGASVGGTLGSL